MKTFLYRASNLKFTINFSGLSFIVDVNFCRPPKTVDSCDTNNNNHLLQTDLLEVY